jgi:hypothetical protein
MSKMLTLMVVAGILAGAPDAKGVDRRNGPTILNTSAFWRISMRTGGSLIRLKSGGLHGKPASFRPPPADWAAVDFDDSRWIRRRGPFFAGEHGAGFTSTGGGKPGLALVCLRGKFLVSDPDKVESLRVDMEFRGGAVIYLNGEEVARAHMPAGKIEPSTPAEDYPDDAFVKPDGEPLRYGYGDPRKHADRVALRRRSVKGLSIPVQKLREGKNVLAVALHRAPYRAVAARKGRKGGWHLYGGRAWDASRNIWSTVGLIGLTFQATGDGIRPNLGRPDGLQVWNHPFCRRLGTTEFGEPTEAMRPVLLSGVRNGVAQAAIGVGAKGGIKGVKVVPSELRSVKGSARIPAAALEVSYAVARGNNETLTPAAPAVIPSYKKFGATAGVWFNLRIPKDAVAGDYSGTVTVSAEGQQPVSVPVRAVVHDWMIPDAQAFCSHLGLVQSPGSVAMQYRIPMWSERHWKLMAASFKLLGEVGNDYTWIPIMRRTHFGNEHSMVRFVPKNQAGQGAREEAQGSKEQEKEKRGGIRIDATTHKPDFSIAERYLDLALKHQGKPDVVCAYGWERFTESDWEHVKLKGLPVTVIDPATKQPLEAWAPKWGTPEAEAFLKPVLQGLHAMLKKRGIEETLFFGTGTDAGPKSPDPWKTTRAVVPGMQWAFRGHPRAGGVKSRYGYTCHVWGFTKIPDPRNKRFYGWKTPWLLCAFPRAGNGTVGALREFYRTRLARYYVSLEGYHAAGYRGFGSMGADYWPVLGKDAKHRNPYSGARGHNCLIGRFPESHYGQVYMGNSAPYILAPGPNGARPTLRFEMLRGAAQLAEARAFVEKALTNSKSRALLGDELAKRAQAVLDERTRAIRSACYSSGWDWFLGSGWQERDYGLYALCAEVAKTLDRREGAEAQTQEVE